jgi:hypothetical protein
MSGGYDLVIASPSSRYYTNHHRSYTAVADMSPRPRRVVYREVAPYTDSREVNVYTRRETERVIYTRKDRDYELYSTSYRRRVYYY